MRFRNCRTDPDYNERYLKAKDTDFIHGYDTAIEEMAILFGNLSVYPDVEQLLTDNIAIISPGKADAVKAAIEDWAEMRRNEIITSMIDNMSDDEYQAARIQAGYTQAHSIQRDDTEDGEL